MQALLPHSTKLVVIGEGYALLNIKADMGNKAGAGV